MPVYFTTPGFARAGVGLLHEAGHILAGPRGGELAANRAAEKSGNYIHDYILFEKPRG